MEIAVCLGNNDTEKNVGQCKHNFVLNVLQPQLAEPAEAEAMSSWPSQCICDEWQGVARYCTTLFLTHHPTAPISVPLFLNVMVENNVVSTVQYDTASNLGRRPGVSLLLGESTLTALFHCKRVDSCLGRLEEA